VYFATAAVAAGAKIRERIVADDDDNNNDDNGDDDDDDKADEDFAVMR
jgi:hypothetical protein